MCARSSCRTQVKETNKKVNRHQHVQIANKDTKSLPFNKTEAFKHNVQKQPQSFDVQPTTTTTSTAGSNARTCLSIPQQAVRRHSVGTTSVATASIIERLQSIAAQDQQNSTLNNANTNENRDVEPTAANKGPSDRTANGGYGGHKPNQISIVGLNKGRGAPIRCRGATANTPGSTLQNLNWQTNKVQPMGISNPDLTSIANDNFERSEIQSGNSNDSLPENISQGSFEDKLPMPLNANRMLGKCVYTYSVY